MGHNVIAVIARSGVANRLYDEYGLKSAALVEGWRLVPLEDDDLDAFQVDFGQTLPGYIYLSPDLGALFSRMSAAGDLVYVETEYFGGMGEQCSAVFSSEKGPVMEKGKDAINKALRRVGFSAQPGMDEFDSIGLSRLRHTSDWKELAEEENSGR